MSTANLLQAASPERCIQRFDSQESIHGNESIQRSESRFRLPALRSKSISQMDRYVDEGGRRSDVGVRLNRYGSSTNPFISLSAVPLKPQKRDYAVSLRQMAHSNGKNHYESVVSYDLPDNSQKLYKIGRYQTMWKKEIPRRNTYIDKIFHDAKKPEATPGVGRYSPNAIDYTYPLEVRQKMSTEKRISHIDKIFIKQKETPGPQSYNFDQALKEKVPGVYLG